MTNLLTAITMAFMVTNTEIKYPVTQSIAPCTCPNSGGYISCSLFHGFIFTPIPNPTTRDLIETVRRIEVTQLPSIGATITNKSEIIQSITTPQTAKTIWESGHPVPSMTLRITNGSASLLISVTNGEPSKPSQDAVRELERLLKARDEWFDERITNK